MIISLINNKFVKRHRVYECRIKLMNLKSFLCCARRGKKKKVAGIVKFHRVHYTRVRDGGYPALPFY